MTLVTNKRNHIIFTLLVFAVCINVQIYAQTDTTTVPLADSVLTLDEDTIPGGDDTVVFRLPKSSLKDKIGYHSHDSLRFDLRGKKVYLYKTAVVTYENMVLEADYIVVDFNRNEVTATGMADTAGVMRGEPVFTIDGEKYNAREMKYNFKTKMGTSKGVMLVEAEGFIRAEKFYKDSNDVSYLRGVTYTTCTNPNPHFHIKAEKFKVIPGKQVICGPANLIVAGVNTPLVIPFGFFPISKTRSRGIVMGTYGESDLRGFFLEGFGYYLPIGENLDLMLTADVSFRGSYGFHARTAYRKRYRYNGNFTFDYNYNEFGEKESPDYSISHDFRVIWNYTRDAKARPGSRFNARVNYVTKNQLRNNSRNVDDIVSTNANSNITYSRSLMRNKLNLTVNGRMDQNLSTGDVNLNLPDVNLNMNRMQPFSKLAGPRKKYQAIRNLGFSYGMSFQNKLFYNQDSLFVYDPVEESRKLSSEVLTDFSYGMRHTLPVATSFKAFQYFNVSPSINFTDYWYLKTLRRTWTGDTLIESEVPGFERAGTYNMNISLTTVIYGMHYSKKKGRKINAVRHVITPSLSANYSPDFTKVGEFGNRQVQADETGRMVEYSIFRDGIVGKPGGAESGSLNLNVGNNLEMKVLSKKDTTNGGIKKVKVIENFNFSGGYDFLRDSLKVRNINMSGNTTLFKVLRMNFGGTLDPYTFRYDDSLKRNMRIEEYELLENNRIGRFTSMQFSFSTNLNPKARKQFTSPKGTEQELEVINRYREYFVDFTIPWSLNLSYTHSIFRQFDEDAVVNQSIKFDGDLLLTENWKIVLSSGYNFTQKELLITRIDFFRDLHCWEFSFGWIPAGTFRRFDFTIRAKAQVLQDLKLSRKGFWYDQF